jgi:threonine/homoserine/homoserine lactone efflux protein
MPEAFAPALAGLGLGIALAGAPGPVQAILLGEVLRGGTARGLRAMAGANLTFGVLLLSLALGFSVAAPSEPLLRALKVVSGLLLLWLAMDGLRAESRLSPAAPSPGGPGPTGLAAAGSPPPAAAPSAGLPAAASGPRRGRGLRLPPFVRGSLAVLLNPGAWLFLATAASSLIAAATRAGGTLSAVLAALALLAGLAVGDGTVVLAGGLGVRRAGAGLGSLLRRGLALALAALGLGLLLNGLLAPG